MKVLIIGASGQVGKYLYKAHFYCGHSVNGTYNSVPNNSLNLLKLNITNLNNVLSLVRGLQPDIIYLTGAQTSVDFCEKEPKLSYQINVVGVNNVILAAQEVKAKLVFYSTDYIFDGLEGFYKENDIPNPINEYGKQKLIAEHQISTNLDNYLIVRTNCVFGKDNQNKNFIARLLLNLKEGITTTVPIDEYITPIYNKDLAKFSILLLNKDINGIYNISGSKLVNRYKFALTTAKIFGYDNFIEPIESLKLNRLAKRPLNGGLDSNKLQRDICVSISSYEEDLIKLKEDYVGKN